MDGYREKNVVFHSRGDDVAKSSVENSFSLDHRLCILNRPPLYYLLQPPTPPQQRPVSWVYLVLVVDTVALGLHLLTN
jgi:hypothetical protein